MSTLFASQQSSMPFPQSLASKYQPRQIADFVGLEKVKRILTAFARNPRPSAFLFIGPPGTGKTTMALALCEAIAGELHHIPSQDCNVETVKRTVDFCHYVPMAGKRFHVVLVDEADCMSSAAQLSLLSRLDATAFPPNTVFVFTCNATERLEPRFLSRCMTCEFSSYGMNGAASEFLCRVWSSETNAQAPNFAQIMRNARNNLREALNLLETEILAAS
jgi:replication-associated recombination protein RarA